MILYIQLAKANHLGKVRLKIMSVVVVGGNDRMATRYKEICGSCMKPVDELITKEDAAGESRTWCKDCWADYDAMMGR